MSRWRDGNSVIDDGSWNTMQASSIDFGQPDGSISRSVSPTEEVPEAGAISGIGFAYSLDEGTTWAAAANARTTANFVPLRKVARYWSMVTSTGTVLRRRPKANLSTIGSRSFRQFQLISGLTTFLGLSSTRVQGFFQGTGPHWEQALSRFLPTIPTPNQSRTPRSR